MKAQLSTRPAVAAHSPVRSNGRDHRNSFKTRRTLLSTALAALLAGAMMPSTAGAAVLTFDDVPADPYGYLASNYGGFNWSSVSVLNATSWGHPELVSVSGSNVAYTSYYGLSTISNTQFDFTGVYLSSPWFAYVPLTVSGYSGGSLLYSQIVSVGTLPSWFQFDFLGIDTLVFSANNGQYYMDDFTYYQAPRTIADWTDPTANLTVGPGGFFGSNLVLETGDSLTEHDLTIQEVGTVVQNGGAHKVNGALLNRGIYQLKGGTLTAADETHNNNYYGYGKFEQTGGTHTVNGTLTVGSEFNTGEYSLIDGILTAFNEIIGRNGTGRFRQSGGSNQVAGTLTVGQSDYYNYGYGTYELDDGELSAQEEVIGDGSGAQGYFTQNGGTNTVSGTLTVGRNGGTGSYDLNDGELSALNEVIGNMGSGFFRQAGGTNTVAGKLTVGKGGDDYYYNYGYGAYHLDDGELTAQEEVIGDGYGAQGYFAQDGGTNTVIGTLTVGRNGGNGTYDLNHGKLSAQDEVIGDNGTGLFNQNGGTNTVAGTLTVGKSGWSAVYNLRAGSLSAKEEVIGDGGYGTLNQGGYGYGTSNNVETLTLGKQQYSSGIYNLYTGILTAVNEIIGDAGSGTFNQSGGTNTVAQTLTVAKKAGSNGTYYLNDGALVAGDEVIGDAGYGSFVQGQSPSMGGANYGYRTSNTVNGTLTLGKQAGGNGSYSLYAGTLSTQNTVVGDAGYGNFYQNGGTHTVANKLTVGKEAGSQGSSSLYGGSLTADEVVIGDAGSGSFSQGAYYGFGNTTLHIVSKTLTLGKQASGTGSYSLSDGVLITGNTVVGDAGTGNFSQYGGHHHVDKTLTLGKQQGSKGYYYLNSSLFNFSQSILVANEEVIGDAGIGEFSQGAESDNYFGYGPTNTTNTLTLGKQASGNGIYYLVSGLLNTQKTIAGDAGNGTFNQYGGKHASGDVTLGQQAGSNGVYNLSGGELASTNTVVGDNGTGTFNHTGGTHAVADTLALGRGADGIGAYTQSGGQLTTDKTVIGDAGAGAFTQTGGTHTTQSLTLGRQASGFGSYTLMAGTLNTTQATLGDAGAASFTQTGGTHNAKNLTLGKQAGSEGTYALRGGNLNVSGDIVDGAGEGALLVSGGSLNFGAGNHDVDVDTLKVTSQGSIKLTDGATTTFQKNVLHNGKAIDLAAGTNAIFNGAFTGKGPFTGAGTATFNDVLNVGDGIGLLKAAGNVKLGDGSKSVFQVAGTTRATGYDAFDIGGALNVDGELSLVALNGFNAHLGDVFDLFSAEVITGQFDLLTLLALGDGLQWKLEYLVDAIGTKDIVRLSVVNSVPLPASVWLLQSALFGLFAARRYSRKNR